jgi:GDSL-like Lipase/Acylhydrolase family
VGTVSVTVSRPAALALSPVLVRQALRVRQRTPRLPEAAGEQRGIEFTANATHLLRLLVVGESTAAGVGVTELREALPRQLAVMLAARGQCNVAWSMSARTGATASFAAEKLAPVAPIGQDIAVVTVGVNDALKFTSRRVWPAHLDQLIDELAKHMRPGGQVALAGLPDLGRFGTFPQPLRALLGWHTACAQSGSQNDCRTRRRPDLPRNASGVLAGAVCSRSVPPECCGVPSVGRLLHRCPGNNEAEKGGWQSVTWASATPYGNPSAGIHTLNVDQ